MLERVTLGEVAPLDTPFSLYIFPTYFCNFKCSYCEHSLPENILEKKPYYKKSISFELFRKVIDDAKDFPAKIKTIIFAGVGEPLIHPKICDMIEYASKSEVADKIEVITNGSLLTHEISDSLVKSGLSRIRVSIQGINSEKYKELCGVNINFNEFIDNLKYLYNHKGNMEVYVKIIDCALANNEEEKKFYDIFTSICDKLAIEHMIDCCEDIDYSKIGNISGLCQHGSRLSSEIRSQPFYMLHLWPDGSVAPCCNYDSPYILGNVNDSSLYGIWRNIRHKNFMIKHLDGYKSIDRCKKCGNVRSTFYPEDKLDDYKYCIAKRLENF